MTPNNPPAPWYGMRIINPRMKEMQRILYNHKVNYMTCSWCQIIYVHMFFCLISWPMSLFFFHMREKGKKTNKSYASWRELCCGRIKREDTKEKKRKKSQADCIVLYVRGCKLKVICNISMLPADVAVEYNIKVQWCSEARDFGAGLERHVIKSNRRYEYVDCERGIGWGMYGNWTEKGVIRSVDM